MWCIPNLLYGLKCESKVKITEKWKVGARSLARNTLGVKGCTGVPRWRVGRVTSINHSHGPAQTEQQVGYCIVWTFLVHGQSTSKHKLTRLTMARTKGKPPPSPLQYTLCLAMGPAPKCHFVAGLPSGNFEIPNIGTPTTLGAHNFVCKPLIEMKSKAKL